MKILYLTYGSQSGVVTSLLHYLRKLGHNVIVKNVACDLSFRYASIKFPRLSVFNLINSCFAIRRFGKRWKYAYLRTDYAFSSMSKIASGFVDNYNDIDIVLQSGLLFRADTGNIPYALGILDNTYLIGKKGRRRPIGLLLSDNFIEEEKKGYNSANVIFVMSNHVRDSLIEDYGISASKIIVTGVGPSVFPSSEVILSDEKYKSGKIVMIGYDFERKGGWDLVNAFNKIKDKYPLAKLVIIGSVRNAVAIDRVEWKGVLNKQEIADELKDANLFVMASSKEPFGIVYIEAMSFATPCIGSDVEAVPEIIKNNFNGFLIKPGDVDELASKIELLLSDPVKAKEMGRKGQKIYSEKFSWDTVISKIDNEFLKMIPNDS